MTKAFYAVFRYCNKKGISSYELTKENGVSQPTLPGYFIVSLNRPMLQGVQIH